jgi:hypothetical protein
MTTEVDALQKTYKEGIYDQLFITQTGNNFDSMYDMFKAATWGGLTRTGARETPGTENYWLMPYVRTSTAIANNLKTIMRAWRYATKYGRGEPNAIFVNDDTYDLLYDTMHDKTGYLAQLSDPRFMELGFKGMAFNGVPITVEPLIPDLEMWLPNFRYCAYVPHPEEDFRMREDGWHLVAENSMDKTCRFVTVGNFVCTNPGAQALVTLADS